MKTSFSHLPRLWAVVAALFYVLPSAVHAKSATDSVVYSPTDQAIEGVMPLVSSYDLTVTSPLGLPAGSNVTITMRASASSQSVGDSATAASYISFSPKTLVFTGPSQAQVVKVTATIPMVTIPAGAATADYAYQIFSDGWPTAFVDGGASINASVSTPPPTPGNAPTVAITSPADGTTYTYTPSGFPASISFNYSASTDSTSPVINSINASCTQSGVITSIPVTTTGMGSAAVSGSGTFSASGPGTYAVQVTAINTVGKATDTHSYIVKVNAPPPTVAISSPTPGSTYSHRLGDAPTPVIFSFSATSSFGGVKTLVAKVDNAVTAFTPVGMGTANASGTITLYYTTAGSHTVSVTATDDNGTATAQSDFTVTLVSPTPVVTISTPTPNQEFTLPIGSVAMNVNYAFTTTSNNGFVVNSVNAVLGATPISPVTTGLGTATAVSSGTLTNLGVGTYTLTATGTSAGITAQASVTFVIKGAQLPPSVVITSPAPCSTYTAVCRGTPALVPLSFIGTSNTPGAVITSLSASLDGTPVQITTTNLGQKSATGTATLSVSTAGTHTISVAAVDAFGNAQASRSFTVVLVQGKTAYGDVFFDVDVDAWEDCMEFGLYGITVKLYDAANQLVGTDVTDCEGDYSFCNLGPGTYTVVAVAPSGLKITTPTRTVTIGNSGGWCGSSCVWIDSVGMGLDFVALQKAVANGYTIGYWKNNIDKAIAGKTNGVQVSRCTLLKYTQALDEFALCPYDDLTLSKASCILGSTSSRPADLLSKQLVAAEYNYQNGAYLNGNRQLTFLFIWWGEHVLSYSCWYSSSYVTWTKDWFDSYNNTHGGMVDGPAP